MKKTINADCCKLCEHYKGGFWDEERLDFIYCEKNQHALKVTVEKVLCPLGKTAADFQGEILCR